MHFAVDGAHPTGAVHHQKIVVVDDAVAFCGGIDLTSAAGIPATHAPDDPRPSDGGGVGYGPRHEVAAAGDGEAAVGWLSRPASGGRRRRARSLVPVDAGHGRSGRASGDPDLRDVEVGDRAHASRAWPVAPKSVRWRR